MPVFVHTSTVRAFLEPRLASTTIIASIVCLVSRLITTSVSTSCAAHIGDSA